MLRQRLQPILSKFHIQPLPPFYRTYILSPHPLRSKATTVLLFKTLSLRVGSYGLHTSQINDSRKKYQTFANPTVTPVGKTIVSQPHFVANLTHFECHRLRRG